LTATAVNIIISLLMSPLLGLRLSLWITQKENGSLPTTRAQCGMVADIILTGNLAECVCRAAVTEGAGAPGSAASGAGGILYGGRLSIVPAEEIIGDFRTFHQ
jgi:hypothetical protein